MFEAFGNFLDKFKFEDEKSNKTIQSNQIATEKDDGAIQLDVDSINQFAMNLDFTVSSQAELIETYREVANYSNVDFAVEDIIGEMISFDEDEDPIKLDLSSIEDEQLSETIKDKCYESFEKISRILDLKQTIHRRAKSFYVDGRLAYQKVIDKNNTKAGLLDAIELDARFVSKYRAVKYSEDDKTITGMEEYYIYDESAGSRKTKKETERSTKQKTALQLNPKSIVYVTSGKTDPKTGYAISWLHKAVKPANQLRMMENALVIYRITRAPERRIFYVDTGNLPKSKAEQYLRSLKNNYRNRMSFDPETGNFQDQRHYQTMQEDYWLPRTARGGTEVSTLAGGQNLDQIEDVNYFKRELYRSLNIPISRLESQSMMPLGRTAEISRDELKFSKFVSGVRKRFNMLFLDLLKTDLILTNVLTAKEWDLVEQKIRFKYALDMYLEEMKQSEMMRDRLDLLREYEPHIGKYVSNDTMRKQVLKQTEEEIEYEDKLMDKEKSDPRYSPPEGDEPGGFGGR